MAEPSRPKEFLEISGGDKLSVDHSQFRGQKKDLEESGDACLCEGVGGEIHFLLLYQLNVKCKETGKPSLGDNI